MCVTHLEYIILAGGCLTAVSSLGKFVREELTGGALLTFTELIKELLAAHLKKDAGSQPVPAEQTDQLAEDGLCPENAPEESSFQASLFRCRRCGQCCRDLEIIVTPRDVERISRHLGKDLAEKEHLSPDRFTWSVYNRVLAKSNERQGEKWPAPGCLFLEESDGISSCTIYEARPSACRRYLPGTERCLRSMHHNHLPG